jgi:hypothetical protein
MPGHSYFEVRGLYFEVLLPLNSGAIVILQEFPAYPGEPDFPGFANPNPARPRALGVAHLTFDADVLPQVRALGGWQEPAHYGPPPHDDLVESSWLFPIERRDEVIGFVHQLVDEIDSSYRDGGRIKRYQAQNGS